MGQCYSVYVEEVAIREGCNFNQLLNAVKEVVNSEYIAQNCVNFILNSKNERELIESICGPYRDKDTKLEYLDYEWGVNDSPNDWHAVFHGSYGWETFMTKCFKAIAPYLATGCSLSIYPDEGEYHLEVQEDGSLKDDSVFK